MAWSGNKGDLNDRLLVFSMRHLPPVGLREERRNSFSGCDTPWASGAALRSRAGIAANSPEGRFAYKGWARARVPRQLATKGLTSRPNHQAQDLGAFRLPLIHLDLIQMQVVIRAAEDSQIPRAAVLAFDPQGPAIDAAKAVLIGPDTLPVGRPPRSRPESTGRGRGRRRSG